MDEIDSIDMKTCRICLTDKKPLCPLFKYKLSGNYAEMLTAIADVKVSSNDGLPEKICLKCCTTLEKAYLLKTVAERSDKKLRKMLQRERERAPTKKIAFDSFGDIKSEIGPLNIKSEPVWEMELDIAEGTKHVDTMDAKDIVIANTVIRKVDLTEAVPKPECSNEDAQVTWSTVPKDEPEVEYLDDDVFQDDHDDLDYVPPEKVKTKFKKPKLSDIKVFKAGKPSVRKLKVIKKIRNEYDVADRSDNKGASTSITCYPILKNGTRGSPILLKRPKDATVLKAYGSHRVKTVRYPRSEITRNRENPVKIIKSVTPKQKEKLVCPVCGILTFTLSNHMTTHQEKKRYSCSHCPRTFAQKTNLAVHMKRHTGVKDQICEICGASFYSQKSLVRHNLIHKGERPFGCDLCTKRFIARCDLNRHLRIHSGYKPYKCSVCAMSFNAKHQLQNHERMHTGERPYTCQVCNVAFSYKVNLNNHVYKAHGINLKFKSIHTVTEEVLHKELGMANETRVALSHIMPQISDVPTPGAHETVLSVTRESY